MAEEEVKMPEEEGKAKQERKSPVNKIIIALMLLLVLGGGYFAWSKGVLAGFLDKKGESATSSTKGGKTQKAGLGPVYAMDTFIVNLVGQGKSYLKTKVELEVDSEPLLDEVTKRLPQLRDAVLLALSSKSAIDINTLEGKYQLRAEIMALLNQHLTTGRITNIYFTDFIIQ